MTTRTGLIRLLAIGLAAVSFLGACGDDDDDNPALDGTDTTVSSDDGAASADGITIEGFAFSDYTAEAGETVTITNNDGPPHTVTADNDEFDSGEIAGGSSGTITAPSEPGTYAYHCNIHSQMTGTLTVA
jgi:plastocyanin